MYINHNPKIFIISGKARSGKNEVADIISRKLNNCIQISYAYYIKQYAKKITNWDGSDITKPRDLLQSLGIDLLKKIDSNFLINRVVEDIKVYSYFYDNIIITDARLVEEIEIPKKVFENVITIRVNRNIDNNLSDIEKKHITETDLDDYPDFDYIINNVTIEQLENDTLKILDNL